MYTLNERDLKEGIYRNLLQKRQYYDCDRYGNCRQTTWSSWGRWVALTIIVMSAFVFFFLCALISARRRRLRGQYPVWGTAWVPGANPNSVKNNHWQYNTNTHTNQDTETNPPPVYTPQQNGNYYAPPPGPPPGQYEMQSPYNQHTQAGNEQFTPPPGPPPQHQQLGTTGEYFPPPNSPPPAHLQGKS